MKRHPDRATPPRASNAPDDSEKGASVPPMATLMMNLEQRPAKPNRVGGGFIPAIHDENGKLIAYGRGTE